MRIWLLIKLLAALAVLGVIAFTAGLAYHITVQPITSQPFARWYAKIVPDRNDVIPTKEPEDIAKMLDSTEMPDIEPGEKAYQKALELIATGEIPEARTKLEAIITTYPSSSSAVEARRIVGEMNLDEVLSSDHMEGKSSYVVVRGDSFLGIAGKNRTSLECLIHLNGLTELSRLQPGDDLIVMPLDFRLLLEPHRRLLSIWQGDRFIKDYPIVRLEQLPNLVSGKTTIESRSAFLDGKKITPGTRGFIVAEKHFKLSKSPAELRSLPADTDSSDPLPRGIYLKASDMEELNLLVRPGNEVEIRISSR